MAQQFDAIIIGTGQAGPPLAARFAKAGMKVAIIERKLFGGTCVNTGCTPTKTLVASAYAAHVARRAADYGVRIQGSVNVDMKAVKARKDAVVAVFHDGLERSLAQKIHAGLGMHIDSARLPLHARGRALLCGAAGGPRQRREPARGGLRGGRLRRRRRGAQHDEQSDQHRDESPAAKVGRDRARLRHRSPCVGGRSG